MVAFLDPEEVVQVANLTSNGWEMAALSLEMNRGTHLVLQQFYDNSTARQLDLYYQHKNLSLTKASWKPSRNGNSGEMAPTNLIP